jgi:predicted AAA+ superfamily ATPase
MSWADLFSRLVQDSWRQPVPTLVDRDARLRALPGKVDAVIGMRRTGKTSLMRAHAAARRRAGAPAQDHVSISFEDERLAGLTVADLHHLPEAVLRLDPRPHDRPRWYYLDEIQNVPGWERFVRRLLDEPGNHLAISGSSAKMLSLEIATSLRGRALPVEVTPLSFRESVRWHGDEVPAALPVDPRWQARLEHAFDRYLRLGGLPEVQEMEPADRLITLQEYARVAVLRDVVERHNISNVPAARAVVRRLLSMPAGQLSMHKLAADLRSLGVAVGRELVHALVSHVEDAFLVATMPIDTESEHQRQVNPRKVFPADPSLHTAMTTGRGGNDGHLLETIVYWELRRRGYELAWMRTRSGFEIDFIARKSGEEPRLVQVCWDISSPATLERELRAIADAAHAIGVARAELVTRSTTGTFTVDGHTVAAVPAWAWLLEAA